MFFNTGQRVILVTSTVNKKGAAVRKGSIGYVSEQGPIVNMTYGNSTIYASQSEVIFTRFGFEEDKGRSEKKTVVMILPVIMSSIEKFPAHFEEVIKKIDNEGPKGDLNNIIQANVGIDVPICIAVPYTRKVNLTDCNDNEFISWLNSHMLCEESRQSFREISHNLIVDKKYGNILDYERINTLCNMSYDKNEKEKKIDLLAGSLGERQRTINALYTCITFFAARNKGIMYKWYSEQAAKGRYGNEKGLANHSYKDVVINLFKEDMYTLLMSSLIINKVGKINGAFHIFKNQMESTKRELLALSRSMSSD